MIRRLSFFFQIASCSFIGSTVAERGPEAPGRSAGQRRTREPHVASAHAVLRPVEATVRRAQARGERYPLGLHKVAARRLGQTLGTPCWALAVFGNKSLPSPPRVAELISTRWLCPPACLPLLPSLFLFHLVSLLFSKNSPFPTPNTVLLCLL